MKIGGVRVFEAGLWRKTRVSVLVCHKKCVRPTARVRVFEGPARLAPMYGDQHPSRVLLREARETTIDQLSESFARDELSLEEFELRLDRAYAASACEEIQALVSDLSAAKPRARIEVEAPQAQSEALDPSVLAAPANRSIAHPGQPRAAFAIFGSVERRGRWVLAPKSEALVVFGNAELDLREAIIQAGTTELEVKAIFGNVEIIVPPTICVECHGASIFGNFEGLERMPQQPDGTPTLRISGKAIFGNVEIRTQVRGQRELRAGARPRLPPGRSCE